MVDQSKKKKRKSLSLQEEMKIFKWMDDHPKQKQVEVAI